MLLMVAAYSLTNPKLKNCNKIRSFIRPLQSNTLKANNP